MSKIWTTFLGLSIFAILASLVLITTNPTTEKQHTLSTQGVRLQPFARYYSSATPETKQILRVGDLFVSDTQKIYRINEIRRTQTDEIYVIVSWKNATNYKSYEDFINDPYSNLGTYEINLFAFSKAKITDDELEKLYTSNKNLLLVAKNQIDISEVDALVANSNRVSSADLATGSRARALEADTIANKTDSVDVVSAKISIQEDTQHSSPVDYLAIPNNANQALTSFKIDKSEELDPKAAEQLQEILDKE